MCIAEQVLHYCTWIKKQVRCIKLHPHIVQIKEVTHNHTHTFFTETLSAIMFLTMWRCWVKKPWMWGQYHVIWEEFATLKLLFHNFLERYGSSWSKWVTESFSKGGDGEGTLKFTLTLNFLFRKKKIHLKKGTSSSLKGLQNYCCH